MERETFDYAFWVVDLVVVFAAIWWALAPTEIRRWRISIADILMLTMSIALAMYLASIIAPWWTAGGY